MHIFTTSATLASLLAHVVFGCCWHHNHAADAVHDHHDCAAVNGAASHPADGHVAGCTESHGDPLHDGDGPSRDDRAPDDRARDDRACPEGRCDLAATEADSFSRVDLSLAHEALPPLASGTVPRAGCLRAALAADASLAAGAPPPRYLVLEILRL